MSKTRILVVSDVRGRLAKLHKKVTSLQRKNGPFDVVLCVGCMFAPPASPQESKQDPCAAFIQGDLRFPMPVYFVMGAEPSDSWLPLKLRSPSALLSTTPLPICENFAYTGVCSRLTVGSLTIAAISGAPQGCDAMLTYALDASGQNVLCTVRWEQQSHTQNTPLAAIAPATTPTDILCTASQPLSQVNRVLGGARVFRYHFCSGDGVFHSSPPFHHRHLTAVNSTILRDIPCRQVRLGPLTPAPQPTTVSEPGADSLSEAGERKQPQTEGTAGFGLKTDKPSGTENRSSDAISASKATQEPTPSQQQPTKKQKSVFACAVVPWNDMNDVQRRELNQTQSVPCPYESVVVENVDWMRAAMLEEPVSKVSGPSTLITATPPQTTSSAAPARLMNRWGMVTVDGKRAPPVGYICRICNHPGHFIQDCPQRGPRKRGRDSEGKSQDNTPPPGYVCRLCNTRGHFIHDCPLAAKKRRLDEGKPASCWFCLSSPEVADHLVIAVGNHSYVAAAKGPIDKYGHVIILPIEHAESLLTVGEDTRREIEAYKACIARWFAQEKRAVALFYERNVPTRGPHHLQLHAIPIPMSSYPQGIGAQLLNTAQGILGESQLTVQEIGPDSSLAESVGSTRPRKDPYIWFETGSAGAGSRHRSIVLVPGDRRQRPRDLLLLPRQCACALLNTPGRVDWKAVAESREAEEALVSVLKSEFQKYDTCSPDDDDSD